MSNYAAVIWAIYVAVMFFCLIAGGYYVGRVFENTKPGQRWNMLTPGWYFMPDESLTSQGQVYRKRLLFIFMIMIIVNICLILLNL